MSDKKKFVELLKSELPRFERVLKAVEDVPKNKHSYKHDKKSRTTTELVNTLAAESAMFAVILKKGMLDFATAESGRWGNVTSAKKYFVKNMKELVKVVEKVSEKDWEKKAQMFMAGKMVWEDERGNLVWEFFLDAIHHRGQLSTHLRPMGGKVPSIYGPSADSGM